jgi:transcription-repair coupling factor (superfamily II helicase)
MKFRDLGLIIVDEEQHFGVNHKERLKELRAEVHVLTLTATPIPRTLQLALTGVRELSLIATPPVDRLAVRTFVTPFDPLAIREALLRERYRGGQSFYVCPRIEDLDEVKRSSIASAGGEGRRRAWADGGGTRGRDDGLLRRQVRRAALDHHRRIRPRHPDRQHADRPPRRHVRPGAALPAARPRRALEDARLCAVHDARRTAPHRAGGARLKVLQSLDTLGAGFQLASHDLDIRGAGNLLGEEQSGHIKEVGYELYQQMLEEAVLVLSLSIVLANIRRKWDSF